MYIKKNVFKTLITLTHEVRIPVMNTPEVKIQFTLIAAKNSAVYKT